MNRLRNRRPVRCGHAPRPVHWLVLLLVVAAGPVRAQDAELDAGMRAYSSADFDGAIEHFTAVASNAAAGLEAKKAAFQYLGRAYVAKHMLDEAREAVRKLLLLDDPMVEFNPDEEPPPLMNLYYEVRSGMDGYRSDGSLQTMAVIDFTNGSVGSDAQKYDALGLGLASMMINFLGGATGLKVVERERLHWLLEELDLNQDANRVDQATAVRAGKLLGAQTVLIGSYVVNRDEMYVGTRLVKVETGEVLLGEQLFGKQDEVFDLVRRLAKMTTESINLTLEDEGTGSTGETHSLDAMMSYSEGLALLEDGAYSDAYEKFQEALDHDPSYARAESRIESLRPMLN